MNAICLVVQSVYDVDPRVRRKAEALVAAGYSVDVLALRARGGSSVYELNGVTIHTIGLGKRRGSLARYLFEYTTFFAWVLIKLPVLMRRRRYAVIDVNTLPDWLVFATVLARGMGAKIVLDMHEITPEFYRSKYGIDGRSRLVRTLVWLERISFEYADFVLTINEPIHDLLVARGLSRGNSLVVMNAVDEERFARPTTPTGSDVPAGAASFVMMYHGTLTRIYGLEIAIEAFARVHDRMPGAELWILGAGPEQADLAALAAARELGDKVRLLGPVAPTAIPGWLARCDVGILPMRRDVFLDFAFPNKLPEFIVAGKPVAMARLKAIGHYFSEDAVAFFEPGDAGDLARQLVRLYQDAGLRARLAAAARLEYAPMRWDLTKQRYLNVVGELAARAPRAAEHPEAAGTTGIAG